MRYNEVVEQLEEDDLNEMLRKKKHNLLYKNIPKYDYLLWKKDDEKYYQLYDHQPNLVKEMLSTIERINENVNCKKNEFTSLIDIIDCSRMGLSVRSRQARVWSKSQFPLTISRSTIRSFWWLSINNKG